MTREEAIEILKEYRVIVMNCLEAETPAFDMAIEALSADAVHGEWEHWGSPFSDESEVIDTIVCSVCGARFIEPKDEPKVEYNFCPNCGADMRG